MGGALRLKLTVLVEDSAPYDIRSVLGEHGLSVLAEVEGGEGVNRFLLDVGQEFSVIARNASILKVIGSLRSVDAVIISHNHYDHSGGLPELLKWLRRRVSVYMHPQALQKSVALRRGKLVNIGVPVGGDVLKELGAELRLNTSPTPVNEVSNTYFLGEVPRVEGPEPIVRDNYLMLNDGSLIPHPLKDDSGAAILIEGYGTVVIAGCSHSGIINIVKHASKITGETVRAVVGGLHLLNAKESEVIEVVKGLRSEGVEELYIGHCTGLKALCVMMSNWKGVIRRISSGYVMEWGNIINNPP